MKWTKMCVCLCVYVQYYWICTQTNKKILIRNFQLSAERERERELNERAADTLQCSGKMNFKENKNTSTSQQNYWAARAPTHRTNGKKKRIEKKIEWIGNREKNVMGKGWTTEKL